MDELAKASVMRQNEFQRSRSLSEDLMNEGLEMCQPNRGTMDWDDQNGQKYGQNLYDDAGVHAAALYANGYQGFTSNPSDRWFTIAPSNVKMEDNKQVREWISDEVEVKLFNALEKGNFYEQERQFILDGISACSATKWVENDPKENISKTIIAHPKENYYSVDKFGDIQCYHRRFKLSIYSAVQAYGLKNLSPELQMLYPTSPFGEHEFLYVNYPKDDDLKKYWKPGQRKGNFLTAIVEIAQQHTIEKASEVVRKPITLRPRFNINEIYGRCPASDAIISLLRLNQTASNLVLAEQLAVAPPMIGPTSLENRLDLTPYGYTGYDSISQDSSVQPLLKGVNLPGGVDLYDRYVSSVNNFFLVPYWTMMMSQTTPMDKVLTATQTQGIQGTQAIMLGPIMSSSKRTNNAFFNRLFYVEHSEGRIADPPPAFFNSADNKEDLGLSIDFIGPLHQAQRAFFKNDSIRRAFESLGIMAELLGPTIFDRINVNETVEYVLATGNMPEKLLEDDATVEAIQKKRAERQEEQINLENAKTRSETSKNLSGAVEEGSPLGEIT